MLAIDQRVRHRKQPAWGIGRVASIGAAAGGLVELVIEFAAVGQRLFKLKPEAVDAMIEPLSAEDTAAIDDAAAATTAARRAGLRGAKKHAARDRVAGSVLAAIATGDGHALVSGEDDTVRELRVYAGDGRVVERFELPDPQHTGPFSPGDRFTPTDLWTDGQGLHIGTRTHLWDLVLFARRGQRAARLWRSPIELGVTTASPLPGTGALVHDLSRLLIAREDGTSAEVPLGLVDDKRTIRRAAAWGDGILVGIHDDSGGDYFQFVYVGRDGAVRHRGSGKAPAPIDDDLMIAFDAHGVLARDRTGAAAGRLEIDIAVPSSIQREETAFARVDDELAFATAQRPGLVRWHPRVDAPRWVCRLPTDEPATLAPPVRVGRFLAVTQASTTATPRVWIVDAETGALAHVLELRGEAISLVPVGDDALVAYAYSTQPTAWRGLSRAKPERVTLTHATKCRGAVPLAAGVVMTYDDAAVSFFDL